MPDTPKSTVRHTPGPWTITTCCDLWVEPAATASNDDDEFRGIALCGGISWPNSAQKQHEWTANARLIAAAPDLLEALKYVLNAHGEQLHDAFDMAQRAIAKAEGVQPNG